MPGSRIAAESERLRWKVEFVLPALRSAAHRFTTHPRIAELYPEYLIQSHWVVRASVPLMEAARARAVELGVADPHTDGLVDYLTQHISEELDHDEWLLEDLEVIGFERRAVLARPPGAAAAALVGAQYYWIHHFDPVALMGYMSVLEGQASSQEQIEQLVARTGYDRRAFRTLFEHADLDHDHADELHRTLDGLSLTPATSTLVGVSAMHTITTLARIFDEIVDSSP